MQFQKNDYKKQGTKNYREPKMITIKVTSKFFFFKNYITCGYCVKATNLYDGFHQVTKEINDQGRRQSTGRIDSTGANSYRLILFFLSAGATHCHNEQ